jgi:hypothetical protein
MLQGADPTETFIGVNICGSCTSAIGGLHRLFRTDGPSVELEVFVESPDGSDPQGAIG